MNLVKYYADWCEPCKELAKEFEENPPKVECTSVDIDTLEEEAFETYHIASVPIIVLMEDNKEIKRWEGFTKTEIINNFIDEYGEQSQSSKTL